MYNVLTWSPRNKGTQGWLPWFMVRIRSALVRKQSVKPFEADLACRIPHIRLRRDMITQSRLQRELGGEYLGQASSRARPLAGLLARLLACLEQEANRFPQRLDLLRI